MRNNPYVLGLVLILSGFLYLQEDAPKNTNAKIYKIKEKKLSVKALLKKEAFHAHEHDESSRSIVIEAEKGISDDFSCQFSAAKISFSCRVGDRILWSMDSYLSGVKLRVKDKRGHEVHFSPKNYNANISFHACDRYLRKGATEATLRNAISLLKDSNNDSMKIICLESGQKIEIYDGPLDIKTDMAIIGTHAETPVIVGKGSFSVFNNENKNLFLYNLKIETEIDNSRGIDLGVGSYLGADNLDILVTSRDSEGVHCFGCSIDGDRVVVTSLGDHSKSISSELGLLELRWAMLKTKGLESNALYASMGSFTNILEDSNLISEGSGPALEIVESGLFFSGGKISQVGVGAAVFLSNLAGNKNEFFGADIFSKNIGFMIKNAKNIFLKNITIRSKGARMVNLGNN